MPSSSSCPALWPDFDRTWLERALAEFSSRSQPIWRHRCCKGRCAVSNLKARVLSALVMGVVVLGATLIGGWLFAVVSTAIAMLVWAEWVDVVCPNGDDRIRLLWLFLSGDGVSRCPDRTERGHAALSGRLPLSPSPWLSLISWLADCGRLPGLPLFGRRTGCADHAARIRRSASGLVALLFLFAAAVWSTDIGAYFARPAFPAGPKIATAISAEQDVGRAQSAVCCPPLLPRFWFSLWPAFSHSWWPRFLAAVLSVVSQIGELFRNPGSSARAPA